MNLLLNTTTADALLGMLSLEPMSGYDLKVRIERSIGNFWSESFGQIYPTLRRLEEKGLVTVTSEAKSGRKIYAITDSGRGHLEDWLGIPPKPRVPRNELLLKLFFGVLVPSGSLKSHVLKERRRSAADLVRYESLAPQIEARSPGNPALPYWLAVLSYGRAQARMIVEWCDETLALLEHMEAEKGSVAAVGDETVSTG